MATQIRAVVITVSDACSRGERADASGEALVRLLGETGAEIVAKEIVSDDLDPLIERLRTYADRDDVNLVITTGGTGFSPRDNTPEATRAVIDREAPGLSEAMRVEMLRRFPKLQVAGTFEPPFRALKETEEQALTRLVSRVSRLMLYSAR